MKTTDYRLTVTTLSELLGTQSTQEVATQFIAKRTGYTLPQDEAETLPDALERATTIFHKDEGGNPVIWDYQFRGFLKAAAKILGAKNCEGGKLLPLQLRAKIEHYVFVSPRMIRLRPPVYDPNAEPQKLLAVENRPARLDGVPKAQRAALQNVSVRVYTEVDAPPPKRYNGDGCAQLLDYYERPLRAETAQGPRVTVARSEMLPVGVNFKCGLTVYPSEVSEEVLRELLDYGFWCGLLQFRTGGFGRFRYELERE